MKSALSREFEESVSNGLKNKLLAQDFNDLPNQEDETVKSLCNCHEMTQNIWKQMSVLHLNI